MKLVLIDYLSISQLNFIRLLRVDTKSLLWPLVFKQKPMTFILFQLKSVFIVFICIISRLDFLTHELGNRMSIRSYPLAWGLFLSCWSWVLFFILKLPYLLEWRWMSLLFKLQQLLSITIESIHWSFFLHLGLLKTSFEKFLKAFIMAYDLLLGL